ncbi:glutaredoxin family protein [Methanohalobium sp.]|uniref:glutaredoxin family protein n=1 Tax=Methanohalobium sp. TaxID=2837493 RepID=UPI002601015F|nr:glutaredoxin family protein [Methanohalobium sp.]
MSEIIIYTTETCPKCEQLKKLLKSNNIAFKEADMSTPEALTELRVNGVFDVTAPILQIGDKFLTNDELFDGGEVDSNAISDIL